MVFKIESLALPARLNEVWSKDFVLDRLDEGQRLEALTIVGDFTKESVEIALDHRIPSPVSPLLSILGT